MGITQVKFTASEEEEIVDAVNEAIAEEEGSVGPPQPVTIDDCIENQVDVSDKVPNPPLIPEPYPKGSREPKLWNCSSTKANDTKTQRSTEY
jgi:hypothetical protein